MIIKNISGSSQDIDIGTAVVTVANNALVALDPGYRWQVNGIYGSKFRVATAAEVGSAGSVASVNRAATVGNPITVDNTDPANPLIDIPVATTLAGGYISAADWNTFNAKLTPVLTSANILVGNGSNVATPVVMSGDATIANTGAVTIANNAVTTAKILNANVTLAKLAAGITPSHVVKFAGQPTTVGGAAAEAFTVTGALSTDLAFVQVVSPGTNTVSVRGAVVTADTLTVTFSADPGNDAIINYQLLRAAS